jgi:hypothetical protein
MREAIMLNRATSEKSRLGSFTWTYSDDPLMWLESAHRTWECLMQRNRNSVATDQSVAAAPPSVLKVEAAAHSQPHTPLWLGLLIEPPDCAPTVWR